MLRLEIPHVGLFRNGGPSPEEMCKGGLVAHWHARGSLSLVASEGTSTLQSAGVIAAPLNNNSSEARQHGRQLPAYVSSPGLNQS